MDLTTCRCRITRGEMVVGPVKRNAGTGEIVMENGVAARDNLEYRIVKEDDGTEMIKIVCDPDDATDDVSKCHVELTIEKCPTEKDANGEDLPEDPITKMIPRKC